MSLIVNLYLTGDCGNNSTGVISIIPTGGISPYDITMNSPTLMFYTSVTALTLTNLSVNNYEFLINDVNSVPTTSTTVSFILSSGFCVNQISYDTTCNQDNGILNVTANSVSIPITYNLYSLTGGYLTTIVSNSSATFYNLSPDIYYVDVIDFSNCTGRTSSCVIGPSKVLDFDLFSIDNSDCSNIPSGKIYVYNETGVPPYTYSWTNALTTKSISGLSAGSYGVTVTDSSGCSRTKSATIINVPKVGISGFLNFPPDCYQSNGQLIATITGGTSPYLYQLNNYPPIVSLNTTETFTGLPAGTYTLQVTDGGLCYTTGTTVLQSVDAFTILSINLTPSNCNNNNGSIEIILAGGAQPYKFEITDTSGNTQIKEGSSPTALFTGLKSDTYIIKVSNSSDCEYQVVKTLINNNKFTITTSVVNTTCGEKNGSLTIFVSSAGTYNFSIGNQVATNINSNSYTFNNLDSGIYNVSVTDLQGCFQNELVLIGSSSKVNFSLLSTGCGLGDEGTITALITDGEPPFTYNWSPNVNGQTGIYLIGLTAGTYTLQLIDSNGCSSTKPIDITCSKRFFSIGEYEICNNDFVSIPATKNGIYEMFNQGYLYLTDGEVNCKLNVAKFTLLTSVSGITYSEEFFVTYNLSVYPTEQDYITALKNNLQKIDGIGSVVIDLPNNSIQVNSDCTYKLSGKNIKVELSIDYNICCVEPTPTPTNTSTPTQTPTFTPTPTQTLTQTPTQTPSQAACQNPLKIILDYVDSLLPGGLSNPSGPSMMETILDQGLPISGCLACQPDCEPYILSSIETFLKLYEFYSQNCVLFDCCWNLETTVETYLKYAEAIGLSFGVGITTTFTPNPFPPLTGQTLTNPDRVVADNCLVGASNMDDSLLSLNSLIGNSGIETLLDKGIVESGLYNDSCNLTFLNNYLTSKGLSPLQSLDYLSVILNNGMVIDYTGGCNTTIYSIDKYLSILNPPACPTPTPTPTITSTPTETPTETPTQTPTLTQTPTSTNFASICFTLYSGIIFQQYNTTPSSTFGTKPVYFIPMSSSYIWWSVGTNQWVHSSVVGSGVIYDTLNSTDPYPIESSPSIVWTQQSVGILNIDDSYIGSCFVLPSQTPTQTPTMTQTTINVDCSTYLLIGSTNISKYDVVTNILTPLTFPSPISASDIANSYGKFWLVEDTPPYSIIEYSIIPTPFSAIYSKTLNVPQELYGLAVKNNTTLISTINLGSPLSYVVVEFDVSGPNSSIVSLVQKWSLPGTNRELSGDLFYFPNTDKLLVTNKDSITNSDYLTQFNYTSGVVEYDILLSPSINDVFGLSSKDDNLYLFENNGNVYRVDSMSIPTFTLVQTTTVGIAAASSDISCILPSQTPTQTPSLTPTQTPTVQIGQSYCVDISTVINSVPSSECAGDFVTLTTYTFTLIDQLGIPTNAPSDVTITYSITITDPGSGSNTYTVSSTILAGNISTTYVEATYQPVNGAPGCPCPCPQTVVVDTNSFNVSIALPNTVSYPCCSEYYNGSGGDLTVSYTDCFGTVFSNVTIGDGQSICCSQSGLPSGPGSGFLTQIGICFY